MNFPDKPGCSWRVERDKDARQLELWRDYDSGQQSVLVLAVRSDGWVETYVAEAMAFPRYVLRQLLTTSLWDNPAATEPQELSRWDPEGHYAFLADCLRNGVNGWGATSTERWFVERLEFESAYLKCVLGPELRLPDILLHEYRKGLPRLEGQEWADYQSASRAGEGKLREWAEARARMPPPPRAR